MGLVDYASDSETSIDGRSTSRRPVTKRRKILPSLPSAFATESQDDPTLHQGRTRSRPFVSGDYNAHVYLSLEIPKSLRDTLDTLIKDAQKLCSTHTIHSFLFTSTSRLHVSITHPLPLRRSQINPFLSDLKGRLGKLDLGTGGAFRLSLIDGVKVYENGRRTGGEGLGGRAFLAIRVGAGSVELKALVDKVVHPILANLHLPLYHSEPEFHTSIAWCLLRPNGIITDVSPSDANHAADEEDLPNLSNSKAGNPITPDMVKILNQEFGDILSKRPSVGGWLIDHLEVKVGKEIHSINLHP